MIGSLDPTGSSDRILSTSGDVEVVLPDGSVVDGTAGMDVPDGAILRLGRDGEAEVDGITIAGAGDYLVTPDGLTLLTVVEPTDADPSACRRAVTSHFERPPPRHRWWGQPTAADRARTRRHRSFRPTTTVADSATTTVVRSDDDRARHGDHGCPAHDVATGRARAAPRLAGASSDPASLTDDAPPPAGDDRSTAALRAVEHGSRAARRDDPPRGNAVSCSLGTRYRGPRATSWPRCRPLRMARARGHPPRASS